MLSPADYAAYSRQTGRAYPQSEEEKAEMYGEVREFRENQLKAPSTLQTAGGIALGAGALAGIGAAAMKLRGRARDPRMQSGASAGKSGVQRVDLSNEAEVRRVANLNTAKQDLGGSRPRRIAENEVTSDFTQLQKNLGEANAIESKYQQRQMPGAFPAPEKAENTGLGEFQRFSQQDDDISAEAKRRQSVYQDVAAKEESELPPVSIPKGGVEESWVVTNPITGEIQRRGGGRPMRAEELRDETVAKVTELASETPAQAEVSTAETLTETYEAVGEPAARVQSIDAADSASDQIDSKFESVVQRDVDSVFEGKPAVAAEKLETYGPLTAQETADRALAQMIQLRQDIYNQSSQPKTIRTKSGKLRIVPGNTVRAERQLAERFKTVETSKIGELSTTGRSLEKAGLPAGPMRQTVQGVETSQSPAFSARSVTNVGEDLASDLDEAASGTSIRGRSRVQNEPERFRTRVDKSGRPITDEFGEELTELDLDTGESKYRRLVRNPYTGELTPEFAPKGQRVLQLFQGEGQPTKSMYIPESDPGGIGIYGEERAFASGPISKFGENVGKYTKTAQRKPTELPYKQKKGTGLTSLSTSELENFADKAAAKGNSTASKAAMAELNRRQIAEVSMQASEAIRRARIEGDRRDPQALLRAMGFGV